MTTRSIPSHIHAQYAEHAAIVAIDSGEVLDGELPRSKMKLVQAWIDIHREELLADWQLGVVRVSGPSRSNHSSEEKAMIKVISVEPMEGHKLRIRLSNGKMGIFDVSPYLDKGVFHELRDPQYFRLVKVAFGGIMWPHEQDFSADTIEYELEEESPNMRLHEDRSLSRDL